VALENSTTHTRRENGVDSNLKLFTRQRLALTALLRLIDIESASSSKNQA
jgi:hypothetical protein